MMRDGGVMMMNGDDDVCDVGVGVCGGRVGMWDVCGGVCGEW